MHMESTKAVRRWHEVSRRMKMFAEGTAFWLIEWMVRSDSILREVECNRQSKQNFLIPSLNDRITTASIVTIRLMIDMCHHTIQMRRKLPDDAHCTHKGSAIQPIQIALIHLARRSVCMYLCYKRGAYQQTIFNSECFNVCKTVDDPLTTATTTVATGWMNDENLNLNWINFEFVKLSSGI